MPLDGRSVCVGKVGVCCRRARRSGWVRAEWYKKVERSREALSVEIFAVFQLLGFLAWQGDTQSTTGQFGLIFFLFVEGEKFQATFTSDV